MIGSVSLLLAAGVLWALTAGAAGLLDLYRLGPSGLLSVAPTATAFAIATYLVSSLALAEIAGVKRLGAALRARVLDRLGVSFSDEPIWWEVLETRRSLLGATAVRLSVRLKDGSVYAGTLQGFPIVRDDVRDKDFALIGVTRYLPTGAESKFGDDEVVLLNSSDCLAIEVSYVRPASATATAQS